jgi:hypothetical protein
MIQASAPTRTALGGRVSGIRRTLSNYQRWLVWCIENLFSRLKEAARIALRRDKTRRSWMGFVYLAAAIINLRLSRFSHTA